MAMIAAFVLGLVLGGVGTVVLLLCLALAIPEEYPAAPNLGGWEL